MRQAGKISASIMCSDLLNLERDIHILEEGKVDSLHIDIMDGHFVPNLTFGPDIVNSIRKKTNLPLDIHMLMEFPSIIIRSMDITDNDTVTNHSECKESILENVAFVKQKGAKFGLALNPDTEIDEVKKYLPYVDVVLLMLIVPGFAGSTMIHGIMDKVGRTRAYLDKMGYSNIELEVDGSITWERAKLMYEQGADVFVGGTKGLFKTDRSLCESIIEFKKNITFNK